MVMYANHLKRLTPRPFARMQVVISSRKTCTSYPYPHAIITDINGDVKTDTVTRSHTDKGIHQHLVIVIAPQLECINFSLFNSRISEARVCGNKEQSDASNGD